MKWSDRKKSAYLRNYVEISDLDKGILNSNGMPWKSDWEIDNQKILHDYADDLVTKGMMYTDTENLFKYSKDINNDITFDDPTYLGYILKIEAETSPLWNYGVVDINEQGRTGSALSFIQKYGDIREIGQRLQIWSEFITQFDKIFNRTLESNTNKKSYYIETITGLDKLMAKMVKYNGDDKLTITLTEDVSLRATYVAELYNNLCYSYNNQRYVMPENTLRFDLLIEISDIRVFKLVQENGEVINDLPPKMIYRLHDCNFDFFNAKPYTETISMAGYNSVDRNPRNLTFDIKYKSITREFESPLIGSINLLNKASKIVDNLYSSNSKYMNNIITEQDAIIRDEKTFFSTTESTAPADILVGTSTSELFSNPPSLGSYDASTIDKKRVKKIKEEGLKPPSFDTGDGYSVAVSYDNGEMTSQENGHNHTAHDHTSAALTTKNKIQVTKGFGATLKQITVDNIQEFTDKLLGRFREIRGLLLNETLRQIREPFNMPKIYPDNVYNPDFRKLSLENFARGLGSDALNFLEGSTINIVNKAGLSVENKASKGLSSLLGG